MDGPDGKTGAHISEPFVAVPRPGVTNVDLGRDSLVYDGRGDRVPLNASAALIWACLDGESTLAEISADLAEGLDAPFETVLADVIAVVTGLVERGFVQDVSSRTTATSGSETPERAKPLRDEDFPLGDAGRRLVRVGDDTVEVRTNDPELVDLLTGALGPLVTSEAVESPTARLSLLAMPDRGRVAGMTYLYRDDDLVFRSASRGRVLRAALAQLEGFLPAPADTVRLDAHVLIGTKGAVLVGGWFREILDLAGRALERLGWTVVDAPYAVVGRDDLQVLVETGRLAFDDDGCAAIDTRYPPGRAAGVRPGRYEITALIMAGSEPDPARLASPAQRLAGVFPLLAGARRPIEPADAEWLARFADHVDIRWVLALEEQELVAVLATLGGRAPRPPMPLPR